MKARLLPGTIALLLVHIVSISVAAEERPNILVLMAEDLSPRIGSYGDTVAQTPNLDELARQGVRYTNVFTAAGVCAPSRAALIAGQHQIAFGGQHMRTSTSPLGEYYAQPAEEVKAFPELLRRAGYYTFTDGKLDYQFSGIQAGSGPFTIWDAEGANTHWRNRRQGQPFFGLINFMETHESGVMRPSGPAHSGSHRSTQRFRKQFGLVAPTITDPQSVKLPSYYPDIPEVRADIARHYDNIHHMDQRVGRILRELEEDGLLHNTIVIWTTDHGDGLPRAKRELYDSGLKVPMLIRFPAALHHLGAPGAIETRLISFLDFAPTLLALAGIAATDYHHGVNFLLETRQYVYASRDRIDEIQDRQRAVRDHRYKYIRSWYPDTPGGHELAYRDNLDMVRAMRAKYLKGDLDTVQSRWFKGPGREQLYDIEADPEEVVNLAAEPELTMIKSRLANALDAWLKKVGDTSAVPETDMRAALLVNGEVPTTPPPTAKLEGNRIHVSAESNASIGYRFGDGGWQVYTKPLFWSEGSSLEIKAVRYGWRESESLRLTSELR